MSCARGDGLQPARLGDAREFAVQLVLRKAAVGGDALVLQFDVEIALVEAGGQLARPFARFVELAVVQQLGDDSGDASGAADDAVAVFLQLGVSRARLVVEVVDVRLADELEHVVVALVRLGEQQKVVQPRLTVARKRVVGGEIDLATVDGLDLEIRPGAGQLGVDRIARRAELRHAAHDPVVGDGDCGHFQLGGALDHVLHVGHAVEQRVFRMVMQVYKRHDLASS